MAKEITIKDKAQRDHLIRALQRGIITDCQPGHRMIAQSLLESAIFGTRTSPREVPHFPQTLQRVYETLIERLTKTTDYPISLERYVNMMIMSMAAPGVDSEFTTLAIGLEPPNARSLQDQAIAAQLPQHKVLRGYHNTNDTSPQALQTIKMNCTLFDLAKSQILCHFYQAAHSPDKADLKSQHFKKYFKSADHLMGHMQGQAAPSM